MSHTVTGTHDSIHSSIIAPLSEVERTGSPTQSRAARWIGQLSSGVLAIRSDKTPTGLSLEALHAEEMQRTKLGAYVLVLLCSVGALLLPFHPIESVPFWPVELALMQITAVCIWVIRRCADRSSYNRWVYRVFGWTSCIISVPIMYYIGIFSPAPLTITVGIVFFGLSRDSAHAIAMPLVTISLYLTLGILITTGYIPDIGMIQTDASDQSGRIFILVMVPVVLLALLGSARRSRSSLISSLEEQYRANWLADERELQIVEAHHEHQVAIRQGMGRRGRFSGSMAGTFRLEDVVGRGAMGEVYRGSHLATGQRVAVKIFHGGGGSIQKAPERFLREGEIARGVVAPNVVRVLDVGQLTDGVPFIAMEYLEGEDLAAVLRKRATLGLDDLVELVSQIACGLEAVHTAGIVHRDLKPQNIFCSETVRGPVWKILDFGVSKLEAAGMTLTENQVVGTPAYMSPEQARGGDLDARSDIFTLAAVVYRCLTGRSPFAAREVPEVLYKIVYHYPPPPRHFAPTINLDVERVLALGLSKNPVHRFQTIAQLADALKAARTGQLSKGLRVRAEALMKLSGWH